MRLFMISIFMLAYFTGSTQTIEGVVMDKQTLEPLSFANIVLEIDGIEKAVTSTDFDGNYVITGFEAGTYDLRVVYIGYQDLLVTKIEIIENESLTIDLEMQESYYDICYYPHIVMYKKPLIDLSDPVSGQTFISSEIQKIP